MSNPCAEILSAEECIWEKIRDDPNSHLWWYLDYTNKSEEFIRTYAKNPSINWSCISYNKNLSESFYEDFSDKIVWNNIWSNPNILESFVEKYFDKVNWSYITLNKGLPESFFEKYLDKLHWDIIILNTSLPESFFERHFDKINGGWLVENHLSTSFKNKCCHFFVNLLSSKNNYIQKLY